MSAYITHCPVCQCQIVVKGNVTKSHETYIECLESLIFELTNEFNGMLYIMKRIISVMRMEMHKREDLEKELQELEKVQE